MHVAHATVPLVVRIVPYILRNHFRHEFLRGKHIQFIIRSIHLSLQCARKITYLELIQSSIGGFDSLYLLHEKYRIRPADECGIFIQIYTGITNRASIPANARITDMISFLLGLFFPKKQITVETIITPPVTIGYCTEASTCSSAMTSR